MPQPDGFRVISPSDVAELENNFERNINEFSPFSGAILPGAASDWFVDSFFGQVYTGVSVNSKGIYGITNEMPHYPEDELANFGYLRVPFRKIPRRIIKSKAELYALVHSLRRANPVPELLFRGQHTEYMLNRSKEASLFLYGNEDALEPSLFASAVRNGVDIDEFALAWTCILKVFFVKHVQRALAIQRQLPSGHVYSMSTRGFNSHTHKSCSALLWRSTMVCPASNLISRPTLTSRCSSLSTDSCQPKEKVLMGNMSGPLRQKAFLYFTFWLPKIDSSWTTRA